MKHIISQEIPAISNENIVYFGQRTEPFFPLSFIGHGITDARLMKERFDLDDPVPWLIHIANEPKHLYDLFNVKSDLDRFLDQLKRKICHESVEYVDIILTGCIAAGEDLVGLAEHLARTHADISSLTKTDLVYLLETFARSAKEYCVYYAIAFFEKPELEIVQDIVVRHASSEAERIAIFKVITTSSRETDTDREREAFLALASRSFHSEREKIRAATAHAAAYGWLAIRFFLGEWWTLEDVLRRMQNITPQEACDRLLSRRETHRELENTVNEFKTRLAEKDARLIDQARNMVYLRTQRADFFNHASALFKPFVEQMARKLGIKYHDLMHFHSEEVAEALRGNFVLAEELVRRKKDTLIYLGDHTAIRSGMEASAYVAAQNVFHRRIADADTITGVSAYRGTVTGKVRIVLTAADSHRVEKGEILVAIMTTPNFVAAMERAASFVTDEGGILCHAAIIAREMKKPCIIGTKIATQVLKDGDLVEVDAEKGTVRKMNP